MSSAALVLDSSQASAGLGASASHAVAANNLLFAAIAPAQPSQSSVDSFIGLGDHEKHGKSLTSHVFHGHILRQLEHE